MWAGADTMKKIYVIGYYGFQNAGDDAMLMGICDELNRRKVPFKFYFKGDSIWKVIKNVVEADIIAVGGGTHLRNWGKGWLWQGLRIVLIGIIARLMDKQFHMWNVGIDGARWEWIMRKVCNFISIRDHETFDSAILMNYEVPNNTRFNIIGVNITPVNRIYFNNPYIDDMIFDQVCIVLHHLLRNRPEWMIRFVSLNSNSKYSDEINIDDSTVKMLEASFGDRIVEFIPYKDNVIDTINTIAECSEFISMRYHGKVLAFTAGVPIKDIGIKSYPSTAGFKNSISIEQARELARKGIKTE